MHVENENNDDNKKRSFHFPVLSPWVAYYSSKIKSKTFTTAHEAS